MARHDRRQILKGMGAAMAITAAPAAMAADERRGSASRLAEVAAMAASMKMVSLVVLHRGETLLSYGNADEPRTVHSMRKSFISALYGQAVAKGEIDISLTLGAIGIDDDPRLTDSEKSATIEDLLKARSGVYLPIPEGMPVLLPRPARGSHAPGTFWCYNNWDFNVLGNIYERLTGKDFFVAFDHNIAAPIGMEDFDPYRDGKYQYAADTLGSTPRYPNYRVSLSARDRARFGQLYLQKGKWGDSQLIPEDWIGRSFTAYSETGQKGTATGYGYLWWSGRPEQTGWPAALPRPMVNSAMGAYGHYIGVLPELDLVIVTEPDTQGSNPHPIERDQYEALLKATISGIARTSNGISA